MEWWGLWVGVVLIAGGTGETLRCENVLSLDLRGCIPEVCICKNSHRAVHLGFVLYSI